MSSPRVSVVCSTYGRAALIPRLIDALDAQTLSVDQFEVIVVDDGSPDGTSAALEELAGRCAVDLRVIRHPTNRGAAAGRNTAWRAARAPVIAFTDDDCSPSPDWLRAGLEALEGAGPGAFVVGPTDPDPTQLSLLERPFSRSLEVTEPRFFETCNVFYWRADLQVAGGLDEAFSTGEDTDLGLRMIAAGRRAVWEQRALVHHRVRPASFRAHFREARHWADLALVVKRHPDMRASLAHHRLFWKRTHPPTLTAVVGIGAAAVLRSPAPLVLVGWWLWHRVVVAPPCPGPRRRILALPGTFVVDVAEVVTMIRGSIRHRTVLL